MPASCAKAFPNRRPPCSAGTEHAGVAGRPCGWRGRSACCRSRSRSPKYGCGCVRSAMTTSSRLVLPARSPMPFTVTSACRAPALNPGQAVGRRHAQVVVAVRRTRPRRRRRASRPSAGASARSTHQVRSGSPPCPGCSESWSPRLRWRRRRTSIEEAPGPSGPRLPRLNSTSSQNALA